MSRGLEGFASEYDVFCYNKPDRESLCGRHVGCLATPGKVFSRGVEGSLVSFLTCQLAGDVTGHATNNIDN